MSCSKTRRSPGKDIVMPAASAVDATTVLLLDEDKVIHITCVMFRRE